MQKFTNLSSNVQQRQWTLQVHVKVEVRSVNSLTLKQLVDGMK